jgi:uncharacterized protein YeaO (DUF488 family)
MSLAIIGTAGRKEDAPRMSRQLFEDVYELLPDLIRWANTTHVILGGAAWMDHLGLWALLTELEGVNSATFHLNSPIMESGLFVPYRFKENGEKVWVADKKHCDAANFHHAQFSVAMWGKGNEMVSRLQIVEAIMMNKSRSRWVEVCSWNNFWDRNTHVAEAEYVAACTFNTGDVPKDGGTLDTWKKHMKNFQDPSRRRHINLFDFLLPDQQPPTKKEVPSNGHFQDRDFVVQGVKCRTKAHGAPIGDDEYRVSISRSDPANSVVHAHIKEWAPNKPLLDEYKLGLVDDAAYTDFYTSQIQKKLQATFSSFKHKVPKGKVLTFLCWEAQGEFCHRHVLRTLLQKLPTQDTYEDVTFNG